jgi:hypothetical protein
MCFLNTQKVPLGECCAVSETCEMLTFLMAFTMPNENKMSDGGRGRASREVRVWKSSQQWSVQRPAVRSIAWLGVCRSSCTCIRFLCRDTKKGLCLIDNNTPLGGPKQFSDVTTAIREKRQILAGIAESSGYNAPTQTPELPWAKLRCACALESSYTQILVFLQLRVAAGGFKVTLRYALDECTAVSNASKQDTDDETN